MTLAGIVTAARHRLIAAGLSMDDAALDARVLAQDVLGWDAARLHTAAADAPPPGFEARYTTAIERRVHREPVAYIVGRREFWNLTFDVSPAVLVPRPETEIVVETVLELFPDTASAITACDVGTGCGCLAVSIACERTAATVLATDISADALSVAAGNAARLGVADRVRLCHADLFGQGHERFDLIVSNPPYVPDGDRDELQAEVRDHEPAAALFGGADGLDVVRRLVAAAPGRLRPGGWLVFEIGVGQAEAVRSLISSGGGLTMTRFRPDLQGIPRTVVARRH